MSTGGPMPHARSRASGASYRGRTALLGWPPGPSRLRVEGQDRGQGAWHAVSRHGPSPWPRPQVVEDPVA